MAHLKETSITGFLEVDHAIDGSMVILNDVECFSILLCGGGSGP